MCSVREAGNWIVLERGSDAWSFGELIIGFQVFWYCAILDLFTFEGFMSFGAFCLGLLASWLSGL